jgi:hypothetical protein
MVRGGSSARSGHRTNEGFPMLLELDPGTVALTAALSAVVSLVVVGMIVVLALRLRALRRDQHRAFDGVEGDVLLILGRHADELADLREGLAANLAQSEHLRGLLSGAVSRVGVIRYDAFDDMGGALSFSAALLDERGDGVVISAINGRTETRCYAKSVSGGRSEQHLSDEEIDAVDAAIEGRPPAILPPEGRRRRRAS